MVNQATSPIHTSCTYTACTISIIFPKNLFLCLLGEVVDGHVHVPLQEDRLHSRDVACIVEDDHLHRTDVKVGLTEHEYIQCINVKLI